ncbi:hypothetical protein C8F04DRAFT_1238258 [Mycena alexandri]|uniref:Uncharacterized protein n=1 Tax=Mycena alexandri TaxID=1745969 RepID=A0AAD6SHU7_9AGAR|nr:hypothetical protein C8F04DRAFT_1238258 [Mycena alexandri]
MWGLPPNEVANVEAMNARWDDIASLSMPARRDRHDGCGMVAMQTDETDLAALKSALEVLGYVHVLEELGRKQWIEALGAMAREPDGQIYGRNGISSPLLRWGTFGPLLIGSSGSITHRISKNLIAAYLEAKDILLRHPNSWWQSITGAGLRTCTESVDGDVFGGLEFDVGEGWGPLCRFLGRGAVIQQDLTEERATIVRGVLKKQATGIWHWWFEVYRQDGDLEPKALMPLREA